MFLLFIYLILGTYKNYTEVNDKVIVEKNDTIKGEFSVIGKDLEVKGAILGNLALINGSLEIEGKVEGDVAVVMGDVEVLKGALITGDIAVVGGKLKISRGAKVEGERINLNLGPLLSPLKFLKFFVKGVYTSEGEAQIGKGEVEEDTLTRKEEEEVEEEKEEKIEESFVSEFFKKITVLLLLVIIFGFLILIIKFAFPGAVQNMIKELELNFLKSLGFGLIFQLVYLPFLLFLIFTILGIPLALFIILATPLFVLYGSSSVFISLGRFILQKFKLSYRNDLLPVIASVVYFLVISLISSLILSLEIGGLLYNLLKLFVFSFLFFNFYLLFTVGTGILFVSKLGIKSNK